MSSGAGLWRVSVGSTKSAWAQRRAARAGALLMAVVVIAPAGVADAKRLSPGCRPDGSLAVCTYRSGTNPVSLPPGVGSITVHAVGGGGESFVTGGGVSPGGVGAMVDGDVAVTPGSTIFAVVGGDGASGGANGGGGEGQTVLNGGRGGGASDVRTSATN